MHALPCIDSSSVFACMHAHPCPHLQPIKLSPCDLPPAAASPAQPWLLLAGVAPGTSSTPHHLNYCCTPYAATCGPQPRTPTASSTQHQLKSPPSQATGPPAAALLAMRARRSGCREAGASSGGSMATLSSLRSRGSPQYYWQSKLTNRSARAHDACLPDRCLHMWGALPPRI